MSLIRGIKVNKFPRLKVNNKRSMIHVDDLCRAMFLVANSISENKIFLVTDCFVYSTSNIYDTISSALNKKNSTRNFPLLLLLVLAYFGSFINYLFRFPFDKKMYDKLTQNEYFSSIEIKKLGFVPKNSFYTSINEMINVNYEH